MPLRSTKWPSSASRDPPPELADAWRHQYPYDTKLSRRTYEKQKRLLQVELLKLQLHVKESGAKVLILFEGRDAAGKGGAIKRFTEHLNPRGARVVALEKPTEAEQRQWYFQRYIQHLPSAGEIVLMDRSWYNRAGVERVMGYCTPTEYLEFMREAPELERMLVNSGVLLTKFWFSVGRDEQAARSCCGRPIRSGNGSSPPPTWRRWTSGRSTPKPRSRCSSTPTPETRPGRW